MSVPLSELGPPLPQTSVSLPRNQRGKTHSPAGEGVGESQFGRLDKKPSTLSTLCQSGNIHCSPCTESPKNVRPSKSHNFIYIPIVFQIAYWLKMSTVAHIWIVKLLISYIIIQKLFSLYSRKHTCYDIFYILHMYLYVYRCMMFDCKSHKSRKLLRKLCIMWR